MDFVIELVWNREFNWVRYGEPYADLRAAKAFANTMLNSGDGARVKKVRVVDNSTGEVLWNG